jgi:hypothetical protein
MKSHRLLRKKEKNNKRNKRRKKTLKKLKGGGLIEDTSNNKWLVCDNPYCWLNHYISDTLSDKGNQRTAKIFKYEKNNRFSSVEDKYKDKKYFFLKIKENGGYINNNFTIVKEKSKRPGDLIDNFFYIGDCFSKIRETTKISSNPRYGLLDTKYENFDGPYEDSEASRIKMKNRDITALSKNNYEDWHIDKIDEWEKILVRSILALLQTIDKDDNMTNDEECLNKNSDIENILHFINSKGRKVSKIPEGAEELNKWKGFYINKKEVNGYTTSGINKLNTEDNYFEKFFGINSTDNKLDVEVLLKLNDLDTYLDGKSYSINNSIQKLEDIYKKYDSSTDIIVKLFNANLENYYHNRGRILLYEQKGSDTSNTGESVLANKIIAGSDQVESQSGSNGARFYREEYKYLTYNNLAEKITNKYILYRFKMTYNTILIGIIKSGCFYIDNETKEAHKLEYKPDNSLGNKYHKSFSLTEAKGATVTEAKGATVTEITQEQKTVSTDELAPPSVELTDEDYIAIYKKIFEMEEEGEDKVNYYKDGAMPELLDASNNGLPFDEFKTKLEEFHGGNSIIDIKDLAYYLPFFKDIEGYKTNLPLLHKKGERTRLIDFPKEVYSEDSIKQNQIFTILEEDIYKGSITNGICHCDICSHDDSKYFINFDGDENDKLKNLNKIKSGELFNYVDDPNFKKISNRGPNVSEDCIDYMNDRLLGEDKKIEYIKKSLINFLQNAVNIPETKDGNVPEDNLFKLLKESSDESEFKLDKVYEIIPQGDGGFYEDYNTKGKDITYKRDQFNEFKRLIDAKQIKIKLKDTVKDTVNGQIAAFVKKRFAAKTDIDIKKIFTDYFYNNDMNNWGRWFGSTRDNRQRLTKIITQYLKSSGTLEQLRESRYETKEESNKEIERQISELKQERLKLEATQIQTKVEEKTKLLKQELSDKTSETEKFKKSIMAMSALVRDSDLELDKMELRGLENKNDETKLKIDKINSDVSSLVLNQSHRVLGEDTSDTISKMKNALRISKVYHDNKERQQQQIKLKKIAEKAKVIRHRPGRGESRGNRTLKNRR